MEKTWIEREKTHFQQYILAVHQLQIDRRQLHNCPYLYQLTQLTYHTPNGYISITLGYYTCNYNQREWQFLSVFFAIKSPASARPWNSRYKL
ncbi:hypothetical protein XBJ1_2086 [Xenorhabdus bovienii SS-2004]|uniref:Uncharacterized protein n=1 Tax=Xenorhabdus bovienii (strain SS-2004) TaxID=406818 RepID=D3V397_XENBS|nr:hypothetical protein XBJ1_2086 [Xenorhabdus bovienii SS-2004]